MGIDEIKEKLVFFLKAFLFVTVLISLLNSFINPLGMISSIFSLLLKAVLISGGFIGFMKRCNIFKINVEKHDDLAKKPSSGFTS